MIVVTPEGNEMTTETISLLQVRINKAFEVIGDANSKDEYIKKIGELDKPHKAATIFKDFHYQVCNGGFTQWMENGYAADSSVDSLLKYFQEIGTKSSLAAVDLLESFKDINESRTEDLANAKEYPDQDLYEDEDEYSYACADIDLEEQYNEKLYYDACNKLDISYYKLDDQLLIDFDVWLATIEASDENRSPQLPLKESFIKRIFLNILLSIRSRFC